MQIAPFMMKNLGVTFGATGNDLYMGFIKDILDEVMPNLGRSYNLLIQQQYGHTEYGKWVGLVGDIVDQVG